MVAAQGPEGQGAVRALHASPDGSRVLAWCAELCSLPLREMLVEVAESASEAALHYEGGAAAEAEQPKVHA